MRKWKLHLWQSQNKNVIFFQRSILELHDPDYVTVDL